MTITKSLLAGLAGGLVATGAKTVCEMISPPRPRGTPSPLKRALEASSLRLRREPAPADGWQEPAAHFLFGTLAGGAYAALLRRMPAAAAGRGAVFGVSFWLVAHELALPWLGLSPTPAEMTAREQVNELVSHVVFGMVLESVRGTLLGSRA